MPSLDHPNLPPRDGAILLSEITPGQLDMVLSKGWRHFGQIFYFYQEAEKEEKGTPNVFQVRPLRIRLSQFKRSKSQRRTWNRNTDLAIKIRPYQRSDELDDLFHLHIERFTEDIPESLETFLGESKAPSPTDTRQFEVRLDGKLIACSFLDIGKTSVSSIYAMFHPAEHRRRLGIFTMLLELDWAQLNNIDLYYSGYTYLEPSHYDYKKSFHGLEFFDWQTWHPTPPDGPMI
jgi:arginine-tRNA-protein transferase